MSASAPPPLDRAELLRLYEISVQEYRFQVLLNWDRAKHGFVLAGVLIGVAAGVAKLGTGSASTYLTAAILFTTFINTTIAALSVRKGHGYYLNTRRSKAQLERDLGLHARGLALTTTRGMSEDLDPAAHPVGVVRQFQRWTSRITTLTQLLFWAIAAGTLTAAIAVLAW